VLDILNDAIGGNDDDGADEDGTADEEDEGDAEAQAGSKRWEESIEQIKAYMKSNDQQGALELSADHSKHERHVLHKIASNFSLVSRTIDRDGHKIFTIARHSPFQPVDFDAPHRIVESFVAKPSGLRSNPSIRGFVSKYHPNERNWTLRFEDDTTEVVDVDSLNTHLR
jgi:hypothetical protein